MLKITLKSNLFIWTQINTDNDNRNYQIISSNIFTHHLLVRGSLKRKSSHPLSISSIAYHVFQFGNLLNIVCGDDGNN